MVDLDAMRQNEASTKIWYVIKSVDINRLFKPAQEKVWLGELTVPQWP